MPTPLPPSEVSFGKRPPRLDPRTLRFLSYASTLPPPPPAFTALPRVEAALNNPHPMYLFPMDGNNRYGNCTIAAVAHSITLYQAFVGRRWRPSAKNAIREYLSLSDGQDSGLYELDVLNHWRSRGFFASSSRAAHKILAYAALPPHSHDHLKQAISIFGAVYLGFRVTEETLSQFHDHQPWTPAPFTGSGHAVIAVAYDPSYLTLLTWGATQRGTWDWWDACVDECYAILPSEAAVSQYAPGFDLPALQRDLSEVTS